MACSSIATGGAHTGVVGGGQAQSVSETQAAHAAEIERVAMGNSAAFATVAAWRRTAGIWILAPAAYVVTGTPGNRQRREGAAIIRKA